MALYGGEWLTLCSSCFTHREEQPPPQYPLYRKLTGPQIQSGHFGEEENLLLLLGLELWIIQPVD